MPDGTTFPISVPFEGDQPLVLDPAATGTDGSFDPMEWVNDNVVWHSEEFVRIMTSAVILFHAEAGTFDQCLHTAIIWERG